MTTEVHPVDALLRAATGDPAPSLADQIRGQRALAEAIAGARIGGASSSRSARGTMSPASWWRPASLATATLVLVFAVVAVTGLLRPQPVTALGELAEVAERVAPPEVRTGEFIYTRTMESSLTSVPATELGLDGRQDISYLERFVVEQWVAEDGAVHRRVTFEEPVFFDAETRDAYQSSPLNQLDRVGETEVDDFDAETTILSERAWPEESTELLAAMRTFVTNEGNPIINDASVLELAADLLRATGANPELRAAVLEALGMMDVEVQQRSNTRSVVVSLQYTDDVRKRLELEFDADANLVREKLINVDPSPVAGTPAGAVLEESVFTPARIVDSLDVP